MENKNKTKCPYCAESIMPGAAKCKHCGEWLAAKSNNMEKAIENNTPSPTMQCRRCSSVVSASSMECSSCGKNPRSFPVIVQIIFGLIIGPIIGWLFVQIFIN